MRRIWISFSEGRSQKRSAPIARATTFHYQLGKVDQAVDLLRETVLPELRQLPGFDEATNLVERGNAKVIDIAYWRTAADL